MDIRLHYLEKGKGTPLLLLHGNGESAEYFEHQISFFSEKYHVYALDTRGHGKSSRGEAPFTLEQFALDLEAFMDEKDWSRLISWVSSMGPTSPCSSRCGIPGGLAG